MPDPIVLVPMFVLLLVIGAFAGVISGLLGVGGGIVLVPGFFYAFSSLGYGSETLMRICVATSLATIVVTSLRSAHAHSRRGAVDWTILRGWFPGIMIGAIAGVWLLTRLRTTELQVIFGVIALMIALYFGFGRLQWRLGEQLPGGLARAAASALVGMLSVLMGIGGGSFGVPLMSLYGVPIHRAVATASAWGAIIAVPSALLLLFTPVTPAPPFTVGAINVPAFATIIVMTLITAPLGARLAHRLDAGPLRRIFAVFLAAVALNMLRKAAGW